jgi:nucleotide-binding universal stress UspA family protein
MLKDIVVNLALGAKRNQAADYAISIADAFQAHLTGIAVVPEPFVPVTGPMETFPADFLDAQRRESERAAKEAVARFAKAADAAGIAAVARTVQASSGGADSSFGRLARAFDLSVIGQSAPGEFPTDAVIEAALFDSGRPVVAVPYIQKNGLTLRCVLVCWDGSRAASRAVGDAMPFLTRAKAVDLVTVQRSEQPSPLEGVEMAEHLARHKVPVDVKHIVSTELDAGNVILSHAADCGADFMVMGGYGHSRIREFVLGGVTRTILESMTLPILMSH